MDKTNVVFIMTDNQGAWTLGCYGNDDILTPNIDNMAEEGVKFSQAYAVNSVCSPSRATFLTGLIPSQHGVHCWLGMEKPDAQIGPDAYCTISEFTNLPRVMSQAGYTCGLSGKWHLGDSIKPQEGFSYWFTKPKGHTSTFYNAEAIWQGKIYREPRYFTDAITDHALDFLAQNHEDPFFLYIAYNGPYGLGEHMYKTHQNRHTDYYADKELPSFPRKPIHPWLKNNREIINNPVSIRGYAAACSGVDDGVGEILNALNEYGLDENTLVIYTADQGLCGGHHGFWGMGDHSRPIHTFEETIHIPLVFRHKGKIPAGSLFDGRTCNYNFFPSILDYLGMAEKTPEASPGKSYANAMIGQKIEWNNTIFHEFENTRMIRNDRWKYTKRYPSGPDQLYDMQEDPGETNNLVGDEKFNDVISDMSDQLDGFFNAHADPKYDMWKSGTSKAGRMI
ncbi:sulfatase-like hydrolase/transferase [Candidatus Poribacteria bacterium]|nr:sulfatase-like hydrolase/transferase [Candidatus Poribacteria bacterium]